MSRLTSALILLLYAAAVPYTYADGQKLPQLSITFPNKVGPLVVGKSNYADLIELLGEPELMENTKIESTKQDILELKYPRKGIEFTVDKNKQMRVVRIEVYRPFSGSSMEGLRLGMPIAEATKLISSRYGKPSVEFEGYVDWEIPNTYGLPNTFALKHEGGFVVAIKMLGSSLP